LRELAEKFRAERRSIVITAPRWSCLRTCTGDSRTLSTWIAHRGRIASPRKKRARRNESHSKIPVALDIAEIGQLAQNLVGLPQEEPASSACISARDAHADGTSLFLRQADEILRELADFSRYPERRGSV